MAPQTRYARNGDVSIAYETFGDLDSGEPLLLIMGLDFQMVWWPEAFCDQLVAAGFAVVRFDNRDTGLSTHFDSPTKQSPWRALLGATKPAYTSSDMLNDAAAVLDAVGWTSAHVMGGSMGAALAQAMALLHPHRVRSLISCMGLPATAGPLRTLTYLRFGIFPTLMTLKPATTRDEEIHNLVTIYRAIASPGFPFPEDWAREVAGISYDRGPRDPRTTQRHLAAGRAVRLPPLSTITAPTLVISGEDDPLVKAAGGRDTARQIPGSTFVSYPGMGHNLPQELWPELITRIRTTGSHEIPTRDAGATHCSSFQLASASEDEDLHGLVQGGGP
ncbi:alpha/beta fold hydrolase [Pseudonocardia sp. T1-2H]|uniref:alpha/beta fold hydrolase n=1 Tax=Pseudonocardia sp. T1-2H TaxID=3128899 RepID=UPI0031019FC3